MVRDPVSVLPDKGHGTAPGEGDSDKASEYSAADRADDNTGKHCKGGKGISKYTFHIMTISKKGSGPLMTEIS